jgi:hypothetical protein
MQERLRNPAVRRTSKPTYVHANEKEREVRGQDAVKVAANLGLSLVLAVTLVFGGCLSCSQYFMFPSSHGCCDPVGHCKRTTPAPLAKDCTIQPMALAKATADASAPPALSVAPVQVTIAATLPADALAGAFGFSLDHASPPNLWLLHSVLRI